MVMISWNDLFNNHLRPALNDTSSSIVDGSRANLLTLFTVSDLQSKGVSDVLITATSGSITSINADNSAAWNLIALGVKYHFLNDPITQFSAPDGLEITRNPDLIQKVRDEYYLNIQAYLKIYIEQSQTASEFWQQYLTINFGSSSGDLTLQERLQLLDRENQHKISQIQEEGIQDLSVQDAKRISALEQLKLKRQYELEDQQILIPKPAKNGVQTASGQVTITHLYEYDVPLEDTVTPDRKGLDAAFFGIPTLIDAQTLLGAPIDATPYKRLDIQLNSSSNISFRLLELVNNAWVQVGSAITDNSIVKSYSLLNTTAIRLEIISTQSNTQLYISADLLAV